VAESSGRSNLIAAVILGVAVIVGAVLVANGLNRVAARVDGNTAKLEEIKTGLAEATTTLQKTARPQPVRQPPRRRGPDPNKVYTVPTKGAPIQGPQTAKIKIVEFSDFQ
jgi:protein-disulfide isomerase